MNYPVGDFLTRIKNACLAKKRTVEIANSKLVKQVAQVLKKEGYLEEIKEDKERLVVRILYRKKEPLILHMRLVSKPGQRVYMGADELEEIKRPTLFIVSTPKGVMSSVEAIKKRLGGEVIVEIL